MLERLVIVLVLLALGFLLYRLFIRYHVARAVTTAPSDPILNGLRQGVPAVVYFTTPNCIPCRTQQQPALSRLQADLGDSVQIVKIDAAEDPAAAQRWGVFSAPTTFILDHRGQPRDVNHGVADFAKLRRQIDALAG